VVQIHSCVLTAVIPIGVETCLPRITRLNRAVARPLPGTWSGQVSVAALTNTGSTSADSPVPIARSNLALIAQLVEQEGNWGRSLSGEALGS
jgi:hypothetical protein